MLNSYNTWYLPKMFANPRAEFIPLKSLTFENYFVIVKLHNFQFKDLIKLDSYKKLFNYYWNLKRVTKEKNFMTFGKIIVYLNGKKNNFSLK